MSPYELPKSGEEPRGCAVVRSCSPPWHPLSARRLTVILLHETRKHPLPRAGERLHLGHEPVPSTPRGMVRLSVDVVNSLAVRAVDVKGGGGARRFAG